MTVLLMNNHFERPYWKASLFSLKRVIISQTQVIIFPTRYLFNQTPLFLQIQYCAITSVLIRLKITVFLLLVMFTATEAQQRYEFESRQMGTTFRILLYTDSDSIAHSAANDAFKHIEYLNGVLSDYLEDSELSKLSDTAVAGGELTVSKTLYDLLEKSVEISKVTNGWFDITIGPYSQIWRGLHRMTNPELPDSIELKEARSRVGYSMISLNPGKKSVKLLKEGMRLDPGGIGKGYAADEALLVLRQADINRALINAGGDISAGDPPPGKDGWNVAIPVHIGEDSTFFEETIFANRSVNTSGSLYQSVEIDDKNYSHIINPKTGLGHTEQVQVSVIAADGADADAFATALNVMPIAKAKELVESRPGLEAVIIWLNEHETVDRWASSGFNDYLK